MNADDVIRSLGLSNADIERLKVFEAAILRWSKVKNLVSEQASKDLWLRHIIDSAQVQRLVPEADIWADLGSGGGLPGIVTSILLRGRPGAVVHLVESDNRKCAFLRHVSRETGARTIVHHGRIEKVVPDLSGIQAVSARALAELHQLVAWSRPLLEKGAVGVFPKGRTVHDELTRFRGTCSFEINIRPSITQPDGSLVVVGSAPPIGANQ